MSIHELTKYIEDLLTIIYENEDSELLIGNINNKANEKTRVTLFVETIIYTLIKSFHNKTSFSIEKLFAKKLEVGKGNYVDSPQKDIRYVDNTELFMEKIIEALKNKEYEIDEDGNVFISNDEVETVVNQLWLYYVADRYIKDTKEKIFLYNKSTPRRINNKEQLEAFVKQSKTFICKQIDMKDQEFSSSYKYAKEQTKNVLRNRHEEKMPLDKIISYFKSFMPSDSEYIVEKYRLPNPIYIIKKAQTYPNFYLLSFEDQEELIIKWSLEYKNNNIESIKIVEELLISPERVKDVNKTKIITGLFILYLSLISKYNIEFNNISLSDIKLKEYIDERVIKYTKEQKALIKVINGLNNSEYKQSIRNEFERINLEIANSDQNDVDKIEQKKSELNIIRKKYQQNEENIQEYKDRVSTLTNLINNINNNGIEEIAFDNPRIIELIISASLNGIIIESPLDAKNIVIEEQSTELGKNKFLARIDIKSLVQLIETINYYLEEKTPGKK